MDCVRTSAGTRGDLVTGPDEPWQHAPEPPAPDLDRLTPRARGAALLSTAGRAVAADRERRPCRCSRHDLASAGLVATASNAGFGMRLPEHVTTCIEPDRPNDPEVQKFWQEVDL